MAMNVLEEMEQEQKRAATRASGTFKPVFLNPDLKNGVKALIRPLFNLDAAVLMPMHHKFNQSDPKQSVNAACSGPGCLNCAGASSDKQLSAGKSFMLPVWLYGEKKQQPDGTWTDVTYKNAEGEEQPVGGLRILELQAFGRIADVLQALKVNYSEEDSHDITLCDFILETHGEATAKKITTMPKAPRVMADKVRAAIPTEDEVRALVLSVCPPAGSAVTASSASALSGKAPVATSSAPEF